MTLVMLDDGTKANHELDASVQVRHLNLMADSHHIIQKIRNTRMRVSRMRATLRELAPDVVLSFCDRTNILTLMAAHALAIPVVVSERSDPQEGCVVRVFLPFLAPSLPLSSRRMGISHPDVLLVLLTFLRSSLNGVNFSCIIPPFPDHPVTIEGSGERSEPQRRLFVWLFGLVRVLPISEPPLSRIYSLLLLPPR